MSLLLLLLILELSLGNYNVIWNSLMKCRNNYLHWFNENISFNTKLVEQLLNFPYCERVKNENCIGYLYQNISKNDLITENKIKNNHKNDVKMNINDNYNGLLKLQLLLLLLLFKIF